MSNQQKIDTKLIHAGEPEKRYGNAVSMPIFQSSTFEYSEQTDYHDIKYIRMSIGIEAEEDLIADIEQALEMI